MLALIFNFFMVTMSLSTIGRYLKLWEFTPKRPAKKAHEKNIKLVEEFKKVTFPQLQKTCEQNRELWSLLMKLASVQTQTLCDPIRLLVTEPI
ncbi:MAG: winged helix-turn-helix domain-containing protein [Deltaproteobacteria bacterium]|nr:winged helix-turn-helix domain-containing protein [Deltaproteobacteria bacterium]